MRWLSLLAITLLAVGCAKAQVGGGGDDDDDVATPDAPDDPDPDGPPPIDGPPPVDAAVTVNLVQTGAQNVIATQIGCQQTNPLTNFTTENSYYRTFPLSDFGITTDFHVADVTFAVERADAGNNVSQPAQLKIGRYTGTINAANFALAAITPLASATINIPEGATTVTTPIAMFSPSTLTVTADTILAVELFIPDGRPAGNIFYIGSNNGTETHPSYIRANDCSVASPTSYTTAVGDPVIRILLSLSGTH